MIRQRSGCGLLGYPMASAFQQPLILVMRSDPEPDKGISLAERECAIRVSYASRPEIADRLKLKRGMAWCSRQSLELLVSSSPDVFGEVVIALPKGGERLME
jgi:hypothetical protein